MNRRSRFYFLIAGLSALIAAGLGVWLLKTINLPQPSDAAVIGSSESKRADPPVTPDPTLEPVPLSAKPSLGTDPPTPVARLSPSPSPAVSDSPTETFVHAGSADETAQEQKVVESATDYLAASLAVNPERGDKFKVLESKVARQADGKGWLVNLKAYVAHAPDNGFPGLLQEVVVEQITLPDSADHRSGEQDAIGAELLRFIVCRLHLIASGTTQAKPTTSPQSLIRDREILERIGRSLLHPSGNPDDEPGPYFRNETSVKELSEKDVRLVVEDAQGKVVSSNAKSFQELGSADVQVLIAWSVAKKSPRTLIVKRLDSAKAKSTPHHETVPPTL